MNNLLLRSITGLLFVVIVISSFYFSITTCVTLILLIQIIAMFEFFKLVKLKYKSINIIKSSLANIFSFLLLISGYFIIRKIETILILSIIPYLVLFMNELYTKNKNPLTNMAITVFPLFLVSLPLFSMLLNSSEITNGIVKYNFHYSLSLFFIIWTNDTGAYITGITIGKNRLFERISPKKSWEGFFGGLVFSIAISYVLSLFFHDFEFWEWAIIATIVVITGTYGDLFESMIKRQLEVKDSGNILPGHGGILDRFDSILFAAPFYYITIQLLLLI